MSSAARRTVIVGLASHRGRPPTVAPTQENRYCRLVIGQRFGNYRALSLLGEGGMGAVYLAEHPDIGRRVAIKVLRPESIKDPQLLTRFLNEARAANAIRHPNIIEILDSGTTPEGTPYLVMELLEGEVLSARIQRLGKMPLAETLEFAYQAASALAAAHDKGIIHRDLKPDNLFIIRDPSDSTRERIKVLDFGIAKLQTFPTGGGLQTRTGTLMGTPVYMSPEQCLGTKAIDQRSDIYALGIIMFEMLAGRPPFVSEGFGALVNMHLNVEPPPLRELDPAIPEPVAAMIAMALRKAAEGRQRSASELQLDIRAAAGNSILIRGVSSPDLSAATLPGGGVPGGTVRAFPAGTTMSSAIGERRVVTVPVARLTSAGRWIALGALVFVGGGLATVAGLKGFRVSRRAEPVARDVQTARPKPVPTGLPPRPRAETPVHVTVQSQPAGATVTEAESGQALGTTPLVIERSASPVPLSVRLQKAGFVSVTRALAVDRDVTETVVLSPAPPPSPVDRPLVEKIKKPPRPHRPTVRSDDEPAKL